MFSKMTTIQYILELKKLSDDPVINKKEVLLIKHAVDEFTNHVNNLLQNQTDKNTPYEMYYRYLLYNGADPVNNNVNNSQVNKENAMEIQDLHDRGFNINY